MTAKFGRITHNNSHFAVPGHLRSPILVPIESSYTASYIKTIARQVLRIKSLEFTNLLKIYTVGVARSFCRRLQLDIVFVKLSIVMVLSTTFTQFASETTKFPKITLNKGHLAVQGHSRSPILVPIESPYTISY